MKIAQPLFVSLAQGGLRSFMEVYFFYYLLVFMIILALSNPPFAKPTGFMNMKNYNLIIVLFIIYFPIFGKINHFSSDSVINNRLSIEITDFAKTLIGTPYKYATQEPEIGFDCSGFVHYVFAHFDIKVPRISREFASIGKEIMVEDANIGDIILFTGTNTNDPTIGHVGIITSNDNGNIQFIHSSSGKNIGVIISNLEGYYQTRLVKIIQLTN